LDYFGKEFYQVNIVKSAFRRQTTAKKELQDGPSENQDLFNFDISNYAPFFIRERNRKMSYHIFMHLYASLQRLCIWSCPRPC